MPSAELLAAAAKLTEAQAELREAELEEDSEYFIGPAPPAVVAEVASSNEAERFEEVLSFPSGIINTVLSFTKFMDSVFARVPTHTSCINR
jgi:precorrin isomerase